MVILTFYETETAAKPESNRKNATRLNSVMTSVYNMFIVHILILFLQSKTLNLAFSSQAQEAVQYRLKETVIMHNLVTFSYKYAKYLLIFAFGIA